LSKIFKPVSDSHSWNKGSNEPRNLAMLAITI